MSEMTLDQFVRTERAGVLCQAIAHCHPADAAQIMVAALDDMSAGPPEVDPFGRLREDAAFWADTAHPAELEAYFTAALRRLGSRALGIRARKRLLVVLWASLSLQDRAAFMARLRPDQTFRGRAA